MLLQEIKAVLMPIYSAGVERIKILYKLIFNSDNSLQKGKN